MGQQGLSTAFGNAIVALFDWAWPRVPPRVHDVAERVKEFLLPDPPMTVTTLTGEVLTGFLLVDRSQVVIFVGSRSPGARAAPGFDHQSRRFDDGSIPMWSRDVDPRDLRDFEVDPYRRR